MSKTEKTKEKTVKWHCMDAEAVVKELDTSMAEGLAEDEAVKRQEKYGKNKIPDAKKTSALMRFLSQFNNVLMLLLIAAAAASALMALWLDALVIIAVVFIIALIGFIQEGKAKEAIESIKKMLTLQAAVIRESDRQTINAEDIVPGDIIILKSGDKVPADARILKSKNLRVEEAPLTGESTDVNKTPDKIDEDAVIGDRRNMVYSGTMVTYGEASVVVVATGADTEIGKITRMISDEDELTTPLLKKIDHFGRLLSVIILAAAAVFFAFGYFVRDYTVMELFTMVISLVVAAIPEGLPAIITIALAIGVQRMARRNAIIRRLPSVETLGSVKVICSDKTGTLTRNEMTVKTIITADNIYEVSGSGYKPEGKLYKEEEPVDVSRETVLQRLIQTVKACNESKVYKEDDGEWKLEGTPTEGSLVTLAYKAGLKDFNPRRLDSIPFESERKFSATLNKMDSNRFIFVKGAPEKLLEMCSFQLTSDGNNEIDHDFWKEQITTIAEKGERVIAAAYREVDNSMSGLEEDNVKNSLVFLGVIGIIDPPRDEVVAAIEECKEAGIRVIMITGDHAITAQAIAEKLGIGRGRKAVTGLEIESMDDSELAEAARNNDVFARTDPEHKLRLVKVLQADNLLCAMTGDGVNDVPALKRSNIGIAMGVKGTEVTKDASEMILADDNFISIVNAVEEGRTVYHNIKKTILFLLPTNGAQSLVLMAAVLLGLILPITPVQILWVNMVTAVTLALTLGVEPMEKRIMSQPPRKPDEPILGGYFIWRVAFVSLLIGGISLAVFWVHYMGGQNIDVSRTLAVNMLVSGQLFYLFNCRKILSPSLGSGFFDNKYVFLAVGVLILLQLLFTYVPFMNTLFGTSPITNIQWLLVLLGGLLIFFIVEVEKYFANKLTKI